MLSEDYHMIVCLSPSSNFQAKIQFQFSSINFIFHACVSLNPQLKKERQTDRKCFQGYMFCVLIAGEVTPLGVFVKIYPKQVNFSVCK